VLKGGDWYDDQEGRQKILYNLQMQSLLLTFVSGSLLRREGALFWPNIKLTENEGFETCLNKPEDIVKNNNLWSSWVEIGGSFSMSKELTLDLIASRNAESATFLT